MAALLAILAGCGKDKRAILSPNPQPPRYLTPSTPSIVLENLRLAYTIRDSTGYKACFDPNYFGVSVDQTAPYGTADSFYYSDESRHIASLARSTTISDIVLELNPGVVRTTDLGDPPGWALIQNPIFKLEIDDGASQYIVPLSSESMEFRFAPTLDSSSPTDTTWKIIRWNEVKN